MMGSPIWFVNLIKKSFSQIFTFAKLTHIPGLGKLVDLALFENDDILYLPKGRTISINSPLDVGDQEIIPSRVVEHFIKKARHRWIMNSCLCRDASTCKDYPVNLGCLFLGEAVLGINQELGRLVSMEEALDHVKRCREAGLVHLVGRNKLDSVWLNVRPGRNLLTICNCCPCCCLWRILPFIRRQIGSKVTKMEGISISVNEHCEGCGTCTLDVCFVKAIQIKRGRAVISDECRGCGRCISVCPNSAIKMTIGSADVIQHTIRRIEKVVDVS